MLREIIIAMQSYGEAHQFISRHRLWKWIIIPGIIYSILFVFGFYLFWTSSGEAIDFMLTRTGLRTWLERLQDSWLQYLFIVGNMILMLILLLYYFSLFKFLFLIVGSPLFAFLSEKTEHIAEGREFPITMAQLLSDAARSVALSFRNMLWQTVYVITILIMSIIPVFGWIAPLLTLFIECYYLGFSMLDYSCERHRLGPRESIRFISSHKGLAIGNGMIFYLMHLLPVLGWILAPGYAVVASTLSLSKAKKQNLIPSL
jgi:CysZ protein